MTTRCGYVAIIGRPNVGKSTLLNRLLLEKVSITSRKPQTTRHQILGVKTLGDCQILYVDTPGMHQNIPFAMNRLMNQAARSSIKDVDVILMMVEGLKWTEEDQWVLEICKKATAPLMLVVNKVDTIKGKEQLLPHLEALRNKGDFLEILPISARQGKYVEKLEQVLEKYLPEGPFLYPSDQVTDKDLSFRFAELIREKLIRVTGDEVPYNTTVGIESMEDEGNIVRISAIIWVERKGQKLIVIGDKGARLKEVGQLARLDMENILGKKIFLHLWVKVRSGWYDDEQALRRLGYGDPE